MNKYFAIGLIFAIIATVAIAQTPRTIEFTFEEYQEMLNSCNLRIVETSNDILSGLNQHWMLKSNCNTKCNCPTCSNGYCPVCQEVKIVYMTLDKIRSYYGKTDCKPENNWCDYADLNKDGQVGIADLSMFADMG